MSGKTTAIKGSRMDVRKMVTMGMLAAIGVVLVAVVHFPLFPAAPFLEYDPADIPILIGTLIYGPIPGLVLTVLVSFLQAVLVSSSSGPIGFVMHVVATGAMVLVAGFIHKRAKEQTRSRTAVALALGAITMTVAMIGMNLVLTPIFMGTPIEAVKQIMVPVIIPFNMIKAGINCVFAFIVHKIVAKIVL